MTLVMAQTHAMKVTPDQAVWSRLKFPQKLHCMLRDFEIQGKTYLASWDSNGTAFYIQDSEELVRHALPYYFHQTKWKSFQRQMNIYSFKRTGKGSDGRGKYSHPFFTRSSPNLLSKIERKKQASEMTIHEQQVNRSRQRFPAFITSENKGVSTVGDVNTDESGFLKSRQEDPIFGGWSSHTCRGALLDAPRLNVLAAVKNGPLSFPSQEQDPLKSQTTSKQREFSVLKSGATQRNVFGVGGFDELGTWSTAFTTSLLAPHTLFEPEPGQLSNNDTTVEQRDRLHSIFESCFNSSSIVCATRAAPPAPLSSLDMSSASKVSVEEDEESIGSIDYLDGLMF